MYLKPYPATISKTTISLGCQSEEKQEQYPKKLMTISSFPLKKRIKKNRLRIKRPTGINLTNKH